MIITVGKTYPKEIKEVKVPVVESAEPKVEKPKKTTKKTTKED